MAELDPKTLKSVLDFAVDAAREAGALTLRYFQNDTPVELKADRTPVTAAVPEPSSMAVWALLGIIAAGLSCGRLGRMRSSRLS